MNNPPGLDKESVLRRLQALNQYLAEVEELRTISAENLREDIPLRRRIERELELICTCVIDIAAHLVASLKLGVPQNQKETIQLLRTVDIVPRECLKKLEGLPGFRNILAHEYLTIDLDEVATVLSTGLDDVKTFAEHVERFLR